MRHTLSLRQYMVLASAVLATFATQSRGESAWANPAGGSFWDSANWSPASVPTYNDAVFGLGSSGYTVSFAPTSGPQPMDPYSTSLRIRNDTVTFDLRAAVGGANPYVVYSVGWMDVATEPATNASLTIRNGRLHSNSAQVGGMAPSSGSVTITGPSAQWTNATDMRIGIDGAGSLSVNDGASVSSWNQSFGTAFGTGALAVNGAGSRNLVNGSLVLAGNGAASMNITNGGGVQANQLYLSRYNGSRSTAIVDGMGSQLVSLGDLKMSSEGWTGTDPMTRASSLTVRNGASVSVNNEVFLGSYEGATATLYVDGIGSSVSGQGLLLGMNGASSTLNITNGATVSVPYADAFVPPAVNTGEARISLSGSGSRLLLTGRGLNLAGRASLTVSDGAQVISSNGLLWLGSELGASLSVDHASIAVRALDAGQTVLMDAGTITAWESARLRGTTQLTGNSSLVLTNFTNPLQNDGDLELSGSSTISANAGMFNYGTLFMNGRSTRVIGGTLFNQGVIQGTGTIESNLENAAEIRVEAGQSLNLAGAYNANSAKIELLFGGTLNTPKGLNNRWNGVISGDGVLRAGSLDISHSPVYGGTWQSTDRAIFNQGRMNFSGTTKVYGDLWHEGGDSTDVIASGGSTLTFFDNVYMYDNAPGGSKPEIRAGAGSRVVYFGILKGDINLTGAGSHEIEGTLLPGFSPGYVSATNLALTSSGTFSYDISGTQRMDDTVINRFGHYTAYDITGTLTLNAGGTLDVNLWSTSSGGPLFSPQFGDSFELIRWSTLAGDPSLLVINLDGAPLSDGLSWQVNWGPATNGSLVLSVVPEPGILLFGAAASSLLTLRRRRDCRRP